MFPASGNVVADASAALDRTLVYLESLGERVLRLHEKGMSPVEIRDVIFGQEAAVPFGGQKLPFSRLHQRPILDREPCSLVFEETRLNVCAFLRNVRCGGEKHERFIFWKVRNFCALIFTKELISKPEDIFVTEVLVGKIFGF